MVYIVPFPPDGERRLAQAIELIISMSMVILLFHKR
jgi:hypothetical protein